MSLVYHCLILCLLALALPGWAATYELPRDDTEVVGELRYVEVLEGDTLVDIARYHGLGYLALRNANPQVDPWAPEAGTRVLLPTQHVLPDTPREGLVLNLPEMRLYYYPPPGVDRKERVMTYPVSIGKPAWPTPLGTTRVTYKLTNPAWYPPPSIRAAHAASGDPLPGMIPPGPDNPLGGYAIGLGFEGYFIHGTNKPNGIGMQVTSGCVRLHFEDIETLFALVQKDTRVRIINQPYKAGWRASQLFIEMHPPLAVSVDKAAYVAPPILNFIHNTTAHPALELGSETLQKISAEARGVPVLVYSGG